MDDHGFKIPIRTEVMILGPDRPPCPDCKKRLRDGEEHTDDECTVRIVLEAGPGFELPDMIEDVRLGTPELRKPPA